MRKLHFYAGIFLLVLGIIFSINSVSQITGFSIAEEIDSKTSFTLGIILVILGIIFLLFERFAEKDLATIVESQDFKKQTKRANKKEIATAIGKIGTGLAHEHPLHGPYTGRFAIKTSKGGRIIYKLVGDKIYLEEYNPSHNY